MLCLIVHSASAGGHRADQAVLLQSWKVVGSEQVDTLQAHLGTCFTELVERQFAVAPSASRLVDPPLLDDPLDLCGCVLGQDGCCDGSGGGNRGSVDEGPTRKFACYVHRWSPIKGGFNLRAVRALPLLPHSWRFLKRMPSTDHWLPVRQDTVSARRRATRYRVPMSMTSDGS